MKKFIFTLIICFAPFLRGAEIVLPAKLAAYEDFIVQKIGGGIAAPKEEGKIRVTIATGDTDVVKRQDEMEIPRGSTATDAGAYWKKKHGTLLLGWGQGLVVVRRKTGNKIERIAWTMDEARTEAPNFQLQNGDVLIGLVYGDY